MPRKTFIKLDIKKQKQVKDAFLREFAIKSYDDASLSLVVKELGIAKGSIYQYFDDKLDLFMFLIGECTNTKMKYIGTVERKNYPDFWFFFRNLYAYGYEFDAENPLESHFLHNLTQNLMSPTVKNLYDKLLNQSIKAFEIMITNEMNLGLFRNDVPAQTMGFLLYKIGVSIMEELEHTGAINPQESIKINQPVYQGKKEILMQTVDNYIELVKPAFDKK